MSTCLGSLFLVINPFLIKPYSRSIGFRLRALRSAFIAVVLASTYLFMYNLPDYGYLTIIIAVICSFIPVTGIEINKDALIIKKYYLFALLCKTRRFNKAGKIDLQPFEVELTDAGDEAAGDGWLSLFLLSMPYKTSLEKITITQQAADGKELSITIRPSNIEYKLLKAFINNK